jgi:hypothetical protein
MAWNPEDLTHDVMERAVRGFATGGYVDYTKNRSKWKTGSVTHQREAKFLATGEGAVWDKLNEIAKKHGFPVADLINTIQRETNNQFNTKIENTKSNAVGLIQFNADRKLDSKGNPIDLGYKTINNKKYYLKEKEGHTGNSLHTKGIKNMSALEQLHLVDEYLTEMHTKGEHPALTITTGRKAHGKKDDAVLYTKEDLAWQQNPNWRVLEEDPERTKLGLVGEKHRYKKNEDGFWVDTWLPTGPITRGSILAHYKG